MKISSGIKTRNFSLALLVLGGLIILSFSFFVVAQENSDETENIFLDSDQDGLTDEEEKLYGTDIHKSDSDGDGYSDGAEVASGYDPLKTAPNDKAAVLGEEIAAPAGEKNEEEGNLTQEVAQKIYDLSGQAEIDGQPVDTSDVQSLIDSVLGEQNIESEFGSISEADIKIKKQDYSGLNEEKAKEKRKNDFSDYLVEVAYIFASNSPEPITSNNDISSISDQIVGDIANALTSRDSSGLQDMEKGMEKVFEQLLEVEVPEEMVETHLKALQYAKYSQNLGELVNPNPDDPVADLMNYSKLEAYAESLAGFYSGIQEKMDEYGIQDSDLDEKMESYGIKISE